MAPSTYAAHENGQNSFGVEEAKRYAAKFRVRWEWILDNEGPPLAELEYVSDPPATAGVVDDDLKFRPSTPHASPELDVRPGAGDGAMGSLHVFALAGGETYRGHEVIAEWVFPPQYIRSELHARAGKTIVLPVQGDSMEPALSPGDRVIVDLSQNRITADGAIYVILDHFDEPQVKRLQVIDDDPVQIRIASDNPAVRDRFVSPDRVKIVGRVVGRVTRL